MTDAELAAAAQTIAGEWLDANLTEGWQITDRLDEMLGRPATEAERSEVRRSLRAITNRLSSRWDNR